MLILMASLTDCNNSEFEYPVYYIHARYIHSIVLRIFYANLVLCFLKQTIVFFKKIFNNFTDLSITRSSLLGITGGARIMRGCKFSHWHLDVDVLPFILLVLLQIFRFILPLLRSFNLRNSFVHR